MKNLFLKLIKARRRISHYQRQLKIGAAGTYIVQEQRNKEGLDGRCVVLTDPESHVSEEFRSIRTRLLFTSADKSMKSILITSSFRGEGKSITVSNLALALAQDRTKKVLLVDADLRKPAIHNIFNIQRKPGLTEILLEGYDLANFTTNPVVDGLYVIPAGSHSPSPSELLGSLKMKNVLERLKDNFDFIIFDTPPIIPVTDAGVLGSLVDGFILVVKAKFVIAMDVERAMYMLENSGAKPLGAILTDVVEYMPYYLHRYKYRYYKYGGDYK